VVVANSRTTLATLAPHPRRQLRMVLYNPLDAPPYEAGKQRLDAQADGGSPAAPLVIGLVGRISPWKGHDVFLRAFAEAFLDADAGLVQARVVGAALFGEEAYADSLRQLCTELGLDDRVEWCGFRDDVTAELAELDVLVHCSTTPEPFGQVVVEGMAAALPVVSTDVGGPAEVIDDGRTGVLVRPGDPHALATVLRRLADDPAERRRLGRAAHEAAMAYRDVTAASSFDAVFRDLGGVHDHRAPAR
jgi:glycosyltransferase involved in cell wall biosynthesis